MPGLLVGVDVGGTKTHVRAESTPGAVVHDRVFPSAGWRATPVDQAAEWLCAHLAEVGEPVAALTVGAQGCEEAEHCARLRAALQERLGVPVVVVNDAQLLLPAAGLDRGVALVVGTGAIAVHSDGGEAVVRAGGWGWVLSDDGSASALVREAARAALNSADRGEPLGPLGELLLRSAGVSGVAELALALSWGEGPERWGTHAPAVVAAAEAGSAQARRVLAEGARSVVGLVETIAGRGVEVRDVVVAGGLVTNVPAYWAAIRVLFEERLPGCAVTLLGEPPVTGAVALARRAAQP